MSEQTSAEPLDTAQFRATAGTMQGFGVTPQDALNALMQTLPPDAGLPIVIWPFNQGDAYWSDAQQNRLVELQGRVHQLSAPERGELEELVATSIDATIARTRSLPLVKS